MTILRAPEDRAGADEIYVAPFQLSGLRHARAASERGVRAATSIVPLMRKETR
jgi:hypothetical protein